MGGWILFEQGKYDGSRRALERWFEYDLENSPQSAVRTRVHREFSLALIDLRQERQASARARLSVIDSLMPSVERGRSPRCQFERNILYAEILIAQDSLAKAIRMCDDAEVPATPSFSSQNMANFNLPILRDTRARAYVKLGERDLAVAEYERIVRFDSASGDHRIPWPKDRYALARLHEDNGDLVKAKEQYRRFLVSWKNADKDLPEIAEAKRKLAQLEKQ